MAREVSGGTVAAFLALFAACAFGQATPEQKTPAATPPPKRPGMFEKKRAAALSSPEFDNARKAIEALTPDQRKRFQENLARWGNLTPEEKKSLADLQGLRRKRIAEEVDLAVKETGLELTPERRELFAKRYAEERRRIEEQLRKETEEKRKPMVREVIGKLKTEFGSSAASATPAPETK